jgi:hypothetical protein
MRQTNANNKQTSICKPNEALISLLTNYEREQVLDAFTDLEELLFQWLDTEQADDTKQRQNFLYSFQILQELGTIIKGISPKKIKALHKQMQQFKTELA